MATAAEWSKGYYEQAKANFVAVTVIQGLEPSATAMLMQMVMEKLAKAALLKSGQITVNGAQSSHAAAVNMIRLLTRNRRACHRLGYETSTVRNFIPAMFLTLEQTL